MRALIGIPAAHSQPEAMQSLRYTWLHDLDADYIFVLGTDDEFTRDYGSKLYGHVIGDTLLIDSPDGPIRIRTNQNSSAFALMPTTVLNRKIEALVRYALDNDYDFLFKCDDDTCCRPDRLLSSGFEQYDYTGLTEKHWTAESGPYRWCQGGAGYWLSRLAMQIIALHGLHLVDAEDFAVGQLLHLHGIAPHHDARYCHLYDRDQIPPEDWITMHKVDPKRMREMYAVHAKS